MLDINATKHFTGDFWRKKATKTKTALNHLGTKRFGSKGFWSPSLLTVLENYVKATGIYLYELYHQTRMKLYLQKCQKQSALGRTNDFPINSFTPRGDNLYIPTHKTAIRENQRETWEGMSLLTPSVHFYQKKKKTPSVHLHSLYSS